MAAASRLLSENRSGGSSGTLYTYDANGNLLSKTFTGGDGSLTGATYTYNLFNQLSTAAENGLTAAYAYNAQGIRTCKATATSQTDFLLDGGNVVGEHVGSKTVTYLRGANLISRSDGSKKTYYLFNAHGDVTELVSDSSTVTHKYDYDAFGVEKKPDPLDGNPFRYCGEYYDGETKTYYLRARYYDPNIGRFTQQDTHWNTANSIYSDNPQKINEREDKLGLKSYSYAPQITAVMQSGNLYVYCISNPALYCDKLGKNICLANGTAATAIEYAQEISQMDGPLPYADFIAIIIILIGLLCEAVDSVKVARKAPPAPPSKLKDGEKVKTPDTHPDEWTKNKDGSYTHSKTGWNAKKDKSQHGGPHWDMKPPKDSGHINVSPDGRIFGGSN